MIKMSSQSFSRQEPEWLETKLGEQWLRIVDVRPASDYARGHIPGAVNLDVFATLYDPDGAVVSAGELALLMSTLGVGDAHLVIFVDDAVPHAATAAARALARYGHRDVHILAGGHPRWVAEGGSIARDQVRYKGASFTARVV
jgi:thiosulfate/3-mercaptopyruvate sulfurtransferase